MTLTREQLLHLADRARRGALLPDEGALLADGVAAMAKDLDFWKQLAQDAREGEGRRTAERDEQQTRAVRAEAAIERALSPTAIRAAAEAIGDEALTHLGRDIGTIHADHIAEAGLRAALNQAQQPTA